MTRTEATDLAQAGADALDRLSKLEQAKADWRANRAYIDSQGNYHLKRFGSTGPIAPWNKLAKKTFADSEQLHRAAHGMPRDLYQLEGQQLRLVLEHIQNAQYQLARAGTNLGRAATVIEQILAAGPQTRDEED